MQPFQQYVQFFGAPPQVLPVSEKKRNAEKYFKKNVETF
jgi:hypothetical protein